MAGCGSSSSTTNSSASSAVGSIAAGTYSGPVACTGSDRFSNGAATRHYSSSPRVSVAVGSGQQVENWTYLFLGRRNTVIQSHAVKPGQAFTYTAGKHIGRAGLTRVTIADTPRSSGVAIVDAILDWSSHFGGYIGSGTLPLVLERRGVKTIRYAAEKVVIKLPRAAPSYANPVVRRSKYCRGDLTG
jgi:hypothetical protein